MMMRLLLTLFLMLMMVGNPALADEMAGQQEEVLYFYREYCETCKPEEECLTLLTAYTGHPPSSFRITGYNLTLEENQEMLKRICTEKGIEVSEVLLPLLILDDVWYEGSQAINYDLPQYGIEYANRKETVIYELVTPACEACIEAEELLAALPEEVEVRLGRYSFISPVKVIRVDISQEPDLAVALFDAWNVPEKDRLTPIAMAGGEYYRGVEAIGWLARYHIKNGDSLYTPIITVNEENTYRSVSVWASALAGLVTGFNPCALSMLLLFLGMLLNLRRSVGRCGGVFLISKFISYLLIGTILLRLLQQINMAWLAPLTRVLMIVLAVPLIVLNVNDAWMARRAQYGKIRNQLPVGLRGRLNGVIERLTHIEGKWFLPAVALLGVLVATGEFLCAGQIYLAEILVLLGSTTAAGMINLTVYCLCFMIPSILVTILMAFGAKKFVIADQLRRHMFVIKLVNSIIFAVALVWTLIS